MRLSACMSGALLGLGACAQLPERVRIDVDGRVLEVSQQGLLEAALLGDGWSLLPPSCDPEQIERIEVSGTGGAVRNLYRCRP